MANRDMTPWRRQDMQSLARDPFGPFRREMDRLFEDFFAPAEGRSFSPAAQAQGMIMPSIDVHESEQAYTVTAELPGIDQKDIELRLDDNTLTLRGEKRTERTEGDDGRRYSERSYGRFERTIPFAAEVDADHIEASCENGVLKIVLPKNARAADKSRRIEIRSSSAASGPTKVGDGRGATSGLTSGGGHQAQGAESPSTTRPGPQPGMEGGYRPTGDV